MFISNSFLLPLRLLFLYRSNYRRECNPPFRVTLRISSLVEDLRYHTKMARGPGKARDFDYSNVGTAGR